MNIRGPKDDVDKAKKLLVNLSNEKQLSSLTAEVRAKPEHHKFLIGRQGKFIWVGGVFTQKNFLGLLRDYQISEF